MLPDASYFYHATRQPHSTVCFSPNPSNLPALVYDTTYLHSTRNEEGGGERIVLHVDFWNFRDMTEGEVEGMRYLYDCIGMYRGAVYE